MPPDIVNYFDALPEGAAYAGGDEGYQIFVFGGGTDIANLKVNFERISVDKRATIVTQAGANPLMAGISRTNAGIKWSYSLRYFSPQYGVSEDSATGSANVVLADYWAQRGLSPPFHAHQCSEAGGAVDTDIEIGGEAVLLGGNVIVAPMSEDDANPSV